MGDVKENDDLIEVLFEHFDDSGLFFLDLDFGVHHVAVFSAITGDGEDGGIAIFLGLLKKGLAIKLRICGGIGAHLWFVVVW